jgi:hypothetical protein
LPKIRKGFLSWDYTLLDQYILSLGYTIESYMFTKKMNNGD